MALTEKQRRWFLGVALALTVAAVAATEGKDEPDDGAVVQPGLAKTRHLQQKGGPDSVLPSNVPLAKLNRQQLSEDVKDMFTGKSWYVAPPPPKPEPPSAPPLPFVYMGKLAEEGEKVVILLTKQDRSYTVREGDVLDNVYRVDEVRSPVMILTYLPLNIKQTIQIGESN
jgi:hypothetical protein